MIFCLSFTTAGSDLACSALGYLVCTALVCALVCFSCSTNACVRCVRLCYFAHADAGMPLLLPPPLVLIGPPVPLPGPSRLPPAIATPNSTRMDVGTTCFWVSLMYRAQKRMTVNARLEIVYCLFWKHAIVCPVTCTRLQFSRTFSAQFVERCFTNAPNFERLL